MNPDKVPLKDTPPDSPGLITFHGFKGLRISELSDEQ